MIIQVYPRDAIYARTDLRKLGRSDFKILGSGCGKNIKRKISEELFIKRLRPDLNGKKE